MARAIQDRWVMVDSSDTVWFTRERNGKPHQHSYLENTMNSMKKQKYMTPEDEPRLMGVQYTTGEELGAIARSSRKNEEAEPKQKRHPGVDMTGDGSKV